MHWENALPNMWYIPLVLGEGGDGRKIGTAGGRGGSWEEFY
jgi:hypothetical protein